MNPMILGFVALLAISSASAGIAHLPEEHEGYQTPFLPIAGPQLQAEALPVAEAYQAAPIETAPALPIQTAQYEAAGHYEAAPIATPIAVTQHIQEVAPQPVTVHRQKTIIKHIQVPYPVDKYVKVDRHVPYYVDRPYKVDRPYEVVKYIQKPVIVKVERKVPQPIISKVLVPQPIVQVEPIVAEPQYAHAQQYAHGHYSHGYSHGHHSW